MKAINIIWDTDGDEEIAASLPNEIEIPDGMDPDAIGDYLSNQTGWCHSGYDLDPKPGEEDC